jgi:AcrR family transcriptional regulator
MSAELPRSTREPGRRGKQGETRARLIQVTVDLLRQEGLHALTTGRITKAAGIAQPGFYAHFKNIDDLVRTAVSQVVEEMRQKIRAVRRRAFDHLREVRDIANLQATRAVYADTLDVLLSDPGFAELFLRYRRDPSLLGGYMREAATRVREDISEDMWRNAQLVGFSPELQPLVSMWAEQILGLFFAAAEAVLDGRYEGQKELIIDALALSSFAIMRAMLRRAGLGEAAAALAGQPLAQGKRARPALTARETQSGARPDHRPTPRAASPDRAPRTRSKNGGGRTSA